MFQPQEIRSEHKDVIHDVIYDYYGQRIATCSSDQTVKVSLITINYNSSTSSMRLLSVLVLFFIWHTFGHTSHLS